MLRRRGYQEVAEIEAFDGGTKGMGAPICRESSAEGNLRWWKYQADSADEGAKLRPGHVGNILYIIQGGGLDSASKLFAKLMKGAP
jgi:hypothetical protein